MKTYTITAQHVEFLDEAIDTLRQIIQGNTDWRGEEAHKALAALLCVIPKMEPTWENK
jgi:DNA-binding PadR family transcriptional regulator